MNEHRDYCSERAGERQGEDSAMRSGEPMGSDFRKSSMTRRLFLIVAALFAPLWAFGKSRAGIVLAAPGKPAMFARRVPADKESLGIRRTAVMLAPACALFTSLWFGHALSADTPVPERIRKAAVAGAFYPAEPERLRKDVSDSLKSAVAEKFTLSIRAIMAPHAGYMYCGQTLAAAYKQIEGPGFQYDTVVLVGACHGMATRAASVSSATTWETPLGPVVVDTALCRRFTEFNPRIEFDDRAHAREHSLEVQLPYLIAAAGGAAFKIVPLVTNSADPMDQELVAEAIAKLAGGPRVLVVVSTDLSHYPEASVAEKVDREMLKAVVSLNPETLMDTNRRIMDQRPAGLLVTMCGFEAVMCLERAAPRLGISEARLVSYTNSAMTGGDKAKVVGYGSVVFTGAGAEASSTDSVTPSFSAQSRRELLSLARAAVKASVAGEWVSFDRSDNPELQVCAGCFVTLKNKGELRGCVGRFTSDAPLWRTVREIGISAATMDDRFKSKPIKPAEVPELHVEVSVLSPLRKVADPLKEIRLGQDGVMIQDRGRSGTFLPQVAGETGWTLEKFLGHCSQDKAGLGWDGWKSPTAQVYSYSVTIIEEPK